MTEVTTVGRGPREAATFATKTGEHIRVHRETFNDKPFIHVRVWWQPDVDGEWKPTRKGIAVPPHLARQIADAMIRLCDQANGSGA